MAKKPKASPVSSGPDSSGPASPGAPPALADRGVLFWLLKSEPDVYSWDDLVAKGKNGDVWTGVRNYQARNNMRAMAVGDLGFFYHSNEGKEIVGILEVCALAHPDPEDATGTWECVDVRAVRPLVRPVTLVTAKAEPRLTGMPLVTNSRLSVQPVSAAHWQLICDLGGVTPAGEPL